MRALPQASALAAVFAVLGCAGADARARAEVDVLRAELEAIRRENEALSRKVQTLEGRVDVVSARVARGEAAAPAPEPRSSEPLVPPTLAVVKVEPPSTRAPGARASADPDPFVASVARPEGARSRATDSAPRARKSPPPVPTNVPIVEPDPERLERLAASAGRPLAAEASKELRVARGRAGLERAHALEDFAARYPRHPEADNALVDAAESYVDAGRADAACALARRVTEEYPAGDALSAGLERLAWCEARLGSVEAERRILARLVAEHSGSPAARRAAERLAHLDGRDGGASAASDSSRSEGAVP